MIYVTVDTIIVSQKALLPTSVMPTRREVRPMITSGSLNKPDRCTQVCSAVIFIDQNLFKKGGKVV